ncbi:MAG TPA: hypothetical protein PLU93_03175 [Treponemataceae bacterium]|jgi:hypothetical protein|nr:hypothetical protein [Treponemataceae bacterium]
MATDKDSFQDYAYRGIDLLLRGIGTLGAKVSEAGTEAAERIDAARVGRRLDALYAELGRRAHALIEAEGRAEGSDLVVSGLRERIGELERQRAAASCNDAPSGSATK